MPRPKLRTRSRQVVEDHVQSPAAVESPRPPRPSPPSRPSDQAAFDDSFATDADRPLPIFNISFSAYRISPLHIGDQPLNPARLARLSKSLRDTLVGDVVRGVQVRLPGYENPTGIARFGALTMVSMNWVLPFGGERGHSLLATLRYEAGECELLLLPPDDPTAPDPDTTGSLRLPLLLVRMPQALRQAVLEFLCREFDCRLSPLPVRGQSLVGIWESWAEEVGLRDMDQPISKLLRKELVVTLGLRLPEARSDDGDQQPLGLRTMDVIIPAPDLRRFLHEGEALSVQDEPQNFQLVQPFSQALGRYLREHLALDLGHQAVQVIRIACGGFVLSEGRLKMFAPPGEDDDQGESRETKAVQRLLQRLCALSTETVA